jgi:hypothetical protein
MAWAMAQVGNGRGGVWLLSLFPLPVFLFVVEEASGPDLDWSGQVRSFQGILGQVI